MELIALIVSIISLFTSAIVAILAWHKNRANYWVELMKFSPESGYENEVKLLEKKLVNGEYSILRIDKQSEHWHGYIATLVKIKK